MVRGFLVVCCPVLAFGCSFVRIGCNSLGDRASIVFVGKVLSPEDPATESILHGTPILFEVAERLRGEMEQRINIYEPGTSCDYTFRAGQSYLVFAHLENGRLTTSELTSTRPVLTASALLRQLRALREGRKPAALFGVLSQHSGPSKESPMADVKIRAISNKETFTTKSESDGSFEFGSLAPGEYRVKAELPKVLVPAETRVLIKRGESCDAETLWTTPDGRISGRVVDRKMTAEPGFLSVFPADLSERDSLQGYDVGKRGHFEIGPLPPGRYRFIFRAKTASQTPFYYPERTAQQPNSAIELGVGQHLDNLTFVLR